MAAATEPSHCPESDPFPSRFVPLAPTVLLIPWQQQGADGIRWDGKILLQKSRSTSAKTTSPGTHTAQTLPTFPVPHCSISPCCRHLGCAKAVGFNTNPTAQMGSVIYRRALCFGVFGDGAHSCSQPVMYSLSCSKHRLVPRYFCSLSKGTTLWHPGLRAGAEPLLRQLNTRETHKKKLMIQPCSPYSLSHLREKKNLK